MHDLICVRETSFISCGSRRLD